MAAKKKRGWRKWVYGAGIGAVGASSLDPDMIDLGAMLGGFLAVFAAADFLNMAVKSGIKMGKPK